MAQSQGLSAMKTMKRRFPDCDKCRRDPVARKTWGCDAPAERPVFFTAGKRPWHRCPSALIADAEPETRRRIARTFKLYGEYDAHNALPCAGGVVDQPEGLMDAFREIDRERAWWDKQLDEWRAKQSGK